MKLVLQEFPGICPRNLVKFLLRHVVKAFGIYALLGFMVADDIEITAPQDLFIQLLILQSEL